MMSFQAYLDNIQAKTGRSPDDFRAYAAEKGWADASGLRAGVRRGRSSPILRTSSAWGTATPWRLLRC